MLILQTCISTELHLRNPKPGIKEQIVEMVHNGAGVRDSSRTLKVDINTVILTLKNAHHVK
ncbi:insA C-terminal domain protein [Escherichia coli B26-2]|nr:insA C-terminal domain protein [Escherichia coli B26-2]